MFKSGLVRIFLLQISITLFAKQVHSYSKVAKSGSVDANENGSIENVSPRIHRAREGVSNVDLWFPEVFNKSELMIKPLDEVENKDSEPVKNTSTIESSGRAIDSRLFPFALNNYNYAGYSGQSNYKNKEMVPSNYRSDHHTKPKYVYPSPVYSSTSNAARPSQKQSAAMDRYTPGEAYAFTTYELKKKQQQQLQQQQQAYLPPTKTKQAQQTRPVPPPLSNPDKQSSNTYIPPRDLYTFPPNTQSVYPGPSVSKPPTIVDSYSPPPSGPSSDRHPSFVGPVSPDVLATLGMDDKPKATDTGESDGDSSNEDDSNDGKDATRGVISAMPSDMPSDMQMLADNAPPPSDSGENQQSSMEQDPPHHPAYLDHDPAPQGHGFDSYPFISDHGYHHDHDYKYSGGLHGIDAFPEILYDHDPHHDYHDYHHDIPLPPPPPPTTTTTTEEPEPEEEEEPEEPEQPRVKKYSYFYLARSLWYIPLYFTVWFTFYVTYLILQSIGRHKVDLPNHTVSRRSVRDLSHKGTVMKVNRLTEFVMKQIDGAKEKYE